MDIKSAKSPVRTEELVSINARKIEKQGEDQEDKIREGIRPESGADYDVSLSPGAKRRLGARQKAFEIAKNTDPVRDEKVQRIKEQIAAGTYKMDSGDTADGILREAIREHLALSE